MRGYTLYGRRTLAEDQAARAFANGFYESVAEQLAERRLARTRGNQTLCACWRPAPAQGPAACANCAFDAGCDS